MRLRKNVVQLYITLFSCFAIGQTDPLWVFADTTPLKYQFFQHCDTVRYMSILCADPTDTGASYNGSKYINFPYQFSNDTLIVKDRFDPDVIVYKDYRPGFAGFKIDWDYGMRGFPVPMYKYLILTHKGPLPGHKVTIRWWYTNGEVGSPSYCDSIGTFASSTAWKTDTIRIPESMRSRPEAQRKYFYYEMVVLINNADPLDTNKSSAPGVLKIDNIKLAGSSYPTTVKKRAAGQRSFNCTGSAGTIRYEIPSSCHVCITYFDIRGRAVASFVNKTQEAGTYSITVPVSRWPKGTYIQVFEAGDYSVKRHVTVLHQAYRKAGVSESRP